MPVITVLQQVAWEGPGLIGEVAAERGVELQIIDAPRVVLEPVIIEGSNGLVILGGPQGVYEAEEYPWLKQELSLCRYALQQKIPVLGICLGSQLLAAAAGGRVYAAGHKEIGWVTISTSKLDREDSLFSDMPDSLNVFQWHGDTFELPPGAELLASSSLFPHQAFRLDNSAYGLQFHLEVTTEMIQEWLTIYKDELLGFGGEGAFDLISRETRQNAGELRKIATGFFRKWIKLIER